MSTNKIAPSIRFKGYTGTWKQCKFSEITYLDGEKNKDNLPYESYSVSNDKGYISQNEQFENGGNMANADKSMYYIVKPNSFVYNPARINVGSIGYSDVPKNTIVSSLYEVFKTTEDVDDRFLWHWFKTDSFQKLIYKLQEGGVRLYFYYDKLCMGEIGLPSLEEQRKIGAYLDSLDNAIAFHKRKCEKLVNIKKSMLDKMFPKNGSKFPEIRFAGFTDAWEQRKVGSFATESSEKGHNGVDAKKLTVKLHTKGVYEAEEKTQGSDNTQYYVRHARQFIYGKQNFFNGAIGVVPENLEKYESTKDVPAFDIDESVNVEWFYQYMARPEIYKPQELNCTGTGSKRFHVNNFLDMNVPTPSYEEQTKIGNYFRQLDNAIILNQRKYEKLVNIKKSMLDKMFI